MIKKCKNEFILLPSIKLTIEDIYEIMDIIKKNKLGSIKFYDEKNNKVNIKKINKEIIYELIIEVIAIDGKNDFNICFRKKGSIITYYYEINSDNLFYLSRIEKFLKAKKVLSIPRKISSKFQVINSLLFMIFYSLNPLVKDIDNLALTIIIPIFLFTYIALFWLDFDGYTRIIIDIKNKFKKFYYKYYSVTNLLSAIMRSLIFLGFLAILSKYFKIK